MIFSNVCRTVFGGFFTAVVHRFVSPSRTQFIIYLEPYLIFIVLYIHRVSKKNCAFCFILFLSELRQISTNFNSFLVGGWPSGWNCMTYKYFQRNLSDPCHHLTLWNSYVLNCYITLNLQHLGHFSQTDNYGGCSNLVTYRLVLQLFSQSLPRNFLCVQIIL